MSRSDQDVAKSTGRRRWPRFLIAAVVVAVAATTFTPAADADEVEQQSSSAHGRANAVLRQAVRAIGGQRALRGLDQFEITASGANRVGYESAATTGLAETSTYNNIYTFDVEGDRLRVDSDRVPLFEAFRFLPPQSFSRVLDGNVGGVTAGAGPAVAAGNLPSESVAALQRQQLLFNPHLLLQRALEQPDLVGYGGRVRLNRRPHRILTIDDDVAEIRLFVDRRTGRISKLETIESHPLVRDTAIEVRYDDWRSTTSGHRHYGRGRAHRRASLRFPTRVELYANGALLWEETRSAVQLDPSLPEGHFDLPPETDPNFFDADGFAFGQQSQHLEEGFFALGFPFVHRPGLAPPAPLGPGVTLLASGANTLVVEHADGLIVLEAPFSPVHGSDIVDAVHQLAPDTPITHIVQSHHHIDHASGVRSLVAAGATLVVGNGVGDFWNDVLTAPSTIRPDALSRSGVPGDVTELDLEASLVLADGDDLTVTVHHTTRDPHAADAVITTIETNGELFVYEADVYNAGFGFTLVIDGPESFFDALRDLNIIDEDCNSQLPLTIVPAHGIALSLQDSLADLAFQGIDVGCT